MDRAITSASSSLKTQLHANKRSKACWMKKKADWCEYHQAVDYMHWRKMMLMLTDQAEAEQKVHLQKFWMKEGKGKKKNTQGLKRVIQSSVLI
ncbi:hypothetical protein QQF64_035091 [Cirrhinus molitorella]|uniref:Uncharacterized protein n=1 Tax=Cirrhinus molitorella TaxID=172907 RepID=A0ABR3NFG5_9TELE